MSVGRLRIQAIRVLGRFGIQLPKGDSYYGRMAANYTAARSGSNQTSAEFAAIAELLDEIPTCASILDVPFGTGRFAPLYLARGMKAYGLEISPEMIAAAKKELGEQFNLCDVMVGDATALPYDDAQFDAVLCIRFLTTIVGFAQASKALRELARVSNGYAILSFNERKDSISRPRIPSRYEAVAGKLYPKEIEDWFRDSGFRIRKKLVVADRPNRQACIALCERT